MAALGLLTMLELSLVAEELFIAQHDSRGSQALEQAELWYMG